MGDAIVGWVAWTYGKVGWPGLVIVVVVLNLAGILLIWRGVDQYKTDHPPTPRVYSLPPEAHFIRQSIENFVYELRQVSGKQFRSECVLVGKERLTPEEPPMELLALTPNAKFSVVKSLSPLFTAIAGVETGFLFEQNPPAIGGRHVARGYADVVEAYHNVLSKPWAVRAHRYVDGVPLTGNETFNICIYGIRPIDDVVVERVLTSLQDAENAFKAGAPKR